MNVQVQNLWKEYDGRVILRDVSFTAPAGAVTCVMAPSGMGKTTLLRILLGLERPDRGSVPEQLRWSAVFQEDRLLEQLDGWANLRFALGSAYRAEEAEKLLAALGLEEIDGKPVRSYSGGMKRRLALARALLAPSDALALDEPFAGLDRESREKCLMAIRAHAGARPVVLVTHEESDAAALGAEIFRL